MYLWCILLSLNSFSSIHCSSKLFSHRHFWFFGQCNTLFLVWKIITCTVNYKSYSDYDEISWKFLIELNNLIEMKLEKP